MGRIRIRLRHISERPKQLRLIRDSLETLDAEIMYGHAPLGEAAKNISVAIAKAHLKSLSFFAKNLKGEDATVRIGLGRESQMQYGMKRCLKQSEYEILIQFGENLGRHDRATQQKHIMLAFKHLEREEEGCT